MDIAVEDLAGGITKVVLRGRFDTTGAAVIEMPFNAVVTEKRAVVVDLSAVNFLSSYAIRVLLVGAKINNVAKVLRTAGTDALIPVFQDEPAATAALAAP
jgi:anti-anti-sigma regulatory factor